MIKSPLNNHGHVKKIASFKVSQLIEAWQKKYAINITQEIKSQDELILYECQDSKIKFFEPLTLTGSGEFYEQLQQFHWYYVPEKWEYSIAIKDLTNCQSILEVGCGEGAFIEQLQKYHDADIQGVELNPNAVKIAQKKQLPVIQQDIKEIAQEKVEHFDAICAFQVLEHLGQPQEFLSLIMNLLRPGGSLLLSVPNCDSFIRDAQDDLLNMPPHHLTHWNTESLFYLTKIFPIQIKHINKEPLALYHVDFYIDILLGRLQRKGFSKRLTTQILHRLLKPLLQNFSSLRHLIVGHTLYVCYQKHE